SAPVVVKSGALAPTGSAAKAGVWRSPRVARPSRILRIASLLRVVETLVQLFDGRQPPGEDVEQDHDRSADERQGDEAEADQQRVDARVIAKARGDAHDLGVAAIDEETSVHGHGP